MSQSQHPLAGVRVVELARVLAGPWIGQTLADLGAEVIKVESPEGDDTRQWGPPFIAHADGDGADAAYFHCCNRGKRSVVADLRTDEGRELVRSLAARADVFIENFKVGALAKYGLTRRDIHPCIAWFKPVAIAADGTISEGRMELSAAPEAIGTLAPALPAWLATPSYIKLNDNAFDGSVPASWAGNRDLFWVDVSNNRLTGAIPPAYANHPSLGVTPSPWLLPNVEGNKCTRPSASHP